MGCGNVLFVVTSHDRMGVLRNRKTGVWLEDFAVAYEILSEAGYEVKTASPLGGEIPVDPDSLRRPEHAGFDPEAWVERKKHLLLESMPLDEIRQDEYDALLYPGGYGSFWDLSVSRENAGLVEAFVHSGRPVAAIRHGDDEERQLALDRVVPFSLGKRLRKCGAEYICVDPWEPHVVVDGMLITGQNTQSAGELAQVMVSAMENASGRDS